MAKLDQGALKYQREFDATVDTVTGGKIAVDAGYPGGNWPMFFRADAVPKFVENANLVEAFSGKQPNFNVDISESDIQQMQKNIDHIHMLDLYGRFLRDVEPYSDPMKKAYYESIWPEPFEAHREYIEKTFDFQKDMVLRKLQPLTKKTLIEALEAEDRSDDLKKIMAKVPGPLDRDTAPDPYSNYPGQYEQGKVEFTRGLLSPSEAKKAQERRAVATYLNPSGDPGKQLRTPAVLKQRGRQFAPSGVVIGSRQSLY